MDKPLARYRDDVDLDKMLKDQERDDDPMLAYMKQKKAKQNIREGNKGGYFWPLTWILFIWELSGYSQVYHRSNFEIFFF